VTWKCRLWRAGMRYAVMALAMACVAMPLLAQEKAEEGPSNERAQKT